MTSPSWRGDAAFILLALAAAPVVGRASARLSRRLAGREAAAPAWMTAGVLTVALSAPVTLGLEPGGLALSWALGSPAELAPGLVLGWALLVLAAVDVAAMRLPDVLTLPLCLAGLAWGAPIATLTERGLGLVLGFGAIVLVDQLYLRLRGRAGIGLGDAKLLGAAGAWLGWRSLPEILLLACAGGFAWVALRILRQGARSAQAPLPFGAPLCAAVWLLWLTARN